MLKILEIPKSVDLINPIEFEGKTIKKLDFNFDNLTGQDLINAQTNMAMAKVPVSGMIEFNKAYLAHIVAKASGESYEAITSLKSKDFSMVTMCAQGFLL